MASAVERTLCRTNAVRGPRGAAGWAGWALGTWCEGKGNPSWEGEEGACHPAVPVGTLQTGSLGTPGTEGEPGEDAALLVTWALLAAWAPAWLGARGGTWRALEGSRGVRGALVLFSW